MITQAQLDAHSKLAAKNDWSQLVRKGCLEILSGEYQWSGIELVVKSRHADTTYRVNGSCQCQGYGKFRYCSHHAAKLVLVESGTSANTTIISQPALAEWEPFEGIFTDTASLCGIPLEGSRMPVRAQGDSETCSDTYQEYLDFSPVIGDGRTSRYSDAIDLDDLDTSDPTAWKRMRQNAQNRLMYA